jgi:hypothetical protein
MPCFATPASGTRIANHPGQCRPRGREGERTGQELQQYLSRLCRSLPPMIRPARPCGIKSFWTGERMAYGTAPTGLPSDGGTSLPGKIARVFAACSLALGAAAWIADFNPALQMPWPVSSDEDPAASFGERFWQEVVADSSSIDVPTQAEVQAVSSERKMVFEQPEGLFAPTPSFRDSRAALTEEPRPTVVVAAIPLPRSRPAEANLVTMNTPSIVQPQDRTWLQKFSDLLPARITLASLAPDGGLFRRSPDLASLGYDNLTAVYDISARVVYMPDGSRLEAHSGLGGLMDDPGHVDQRNAGATPPNVYELKPREQLFHGVQALRMTPVGDQGTLGRSGLLAHSYMLGPNGDSNGCVSIRDYEKFLAAFTRGEIKRLVVVPRLGDEASASRRST